MSGKRLQGARCETFGAGCGRLLVVLVGRPNNGCICEGGEAGHAERGWGI